MKNITLKELYQLKKELLKLQTKDSLTYHEKKTLNELQKRIATIANLSDRNGNKIRLGSVFEAKFRNGGKETFMLVEKTSFFESEAHFVQLGSQFGNSIMGKREGEAFSYHEKQELIEGTIIKVMTKK